MPALVLLGRRWRVASDDFFYDGLFYTILGVLWLSIFSLEIRAFPDSCRDPLQLKNLLVALLVAAVLSVAINVPMMWLSSRGTIMNVEPRQRIGLVLYARSILAVAELVLTIKAWMIFFKDPSDCVRQTTIVVIKGVCIIYSLILILKLVHFLMAFDSLGKRYCRTLSQKDSDVDGFEKAYGVWKDRCKLLTCCCIWESSAKSAFEDVAKLFASLFWDVDLVPSDIFAGLVLLFQKYEMLPMREHSPVEAQIPSWMTVNTASYYYKYALGLYGWSYIILLHPCTWTCRLAKGLRCCCLWRGAAVEEDSCGCNRSALRLVTGLRPENIVFVSFRNRVYQVPFMVVLDHDRRSVVVAIRGSISLRDVLTDLTAECEPFECGGDATPDAAAHRGILKATRYVHDRVVGGGYLDEAFGFHPDYELVVVGHSLGAGVAALLGLMLRSRYPDVKCFLYGAPGGVLSQEVAEQTEAFMMTVVLGYDFVPRLSLSNLEGLKGALIEALNTCNKPKYKVLTKEILKIIFANETALTLEVQAENTPMVRGCNNLYYNSIRCGQAFPRLRMPGRILHLVRSESSRDGRRLQAFWRKATFFDRILVTPHMLTDHLPLSIGNAMKAFLEAEASGPTS